MIRPSLLTLLLTLWMPPLLAQTLARTQAVPGGIAVVKLGPAATRPTARFNQKPVLVSGDHNGWRAIVGIPLKTATGEHRLQVTLGEQQRQLGFQIQSKSYATQRITLKNKRMVDPTPKDLERIWAEQKRIRAALATFSDPLPQLEIQWPLQGRISGRFGLNRFFNGKPRKPHSGIDIAAPKGTPVSAIAPGRVVETGDYYFNGRTVFIDHGRGMVSMYCHLDKIHVQPGDSVQQGQAFAEVGMTGRATGPHLHWGVTLNQTMIDPRMLMPQAVVAQLEAPQNDN